MRSARWLVLAALVVCLPALAPSLRPAAQAPPSEATAPARAEPPPAAALSIAGVWLLDERASDDPVERVKELQAGQAGQGRGPTWGVGRGGVPGVTVGSGFPGRGRGGSGGRGGGGGGGPDQETAWVDHLARGLLVLKIEASPDQVVLRNANRETRVFFLDGRLGGDGLGSQTRARLDDGTLEVETASAEARRVETFAVDGTGRLILTTEIQSGRLPALQFRSVYERVRDPEAAAVGTEAAVGGAVVPDAAGSAVSTPVERVADRPIGAAGAGTPGNGAPYPAPAAPAPAADRPVTVTARLVGDGDDDRAHRSILRLLPPARPAAGRLTGKVLIETLTIDPAIATVEFSLDGEVVERRRSVPFEARLTLADPPREQVVRAAAYSLGGVLLGADQLVLNRYDPPFRVRVAAIERDRDAGTVRVRAEVEVPRKAALESVVFYRGDQEIVRLDRAPYFVDVPSRDLGADDYVRVVAALADGRRLEDVAIFTGSDFTAKVDVRLVQLQVLVTDRDGFTVSGLGPDDFEVSEAGESRPIERLYPSRDVALVLGMAIDSSGSMGPLWQQTKGAAQLFLDGVLTPRDRAFLVDFDSRLRLLQPLTPDKLRLFAALDRLEAWGGTALYDSILFSMLQFEDEPGRRALIVISDGVDSESRADPARAVDFGKRLGIPVYVVALVRADGPGAGAIGTGFGDGAAARGNLMLITEPTGGRLFRAATQAQVANALAQIEDELRSQYVLTFYTERRPEETVVPVVTLKRRDLRVKTAFPLDLAD